MDGALFVSYFGRIFLPNLDPESTDPAYRFSFFFSRSIFVGKFAGQYHELNLACSSAFTVRLTLDPLLNKLLNRFMLVSEIVWLSDL